MFMWNLSRNSMTFIISCLLILTVLIKAYTNLIRLVLFQVHIAINHDDGDLVVSQRAKYMHGLVMLQP